MATEEKPLPCPFCGREPIIRPELYDKFPGIGEVSCSPFFPREERCHAMVRVKDTLEPATLDDKNWPSAAAFRASAITAWNKRADLSQ